MARPGGGGQGRWLGAALLLGLLAAPAGAAAGAAAGTVTLSEEHGYTAGWAVKGTRVEVTLTKAWTADSGLWLGFGLAENTSGHMIGSDVVTVEWKGPGSEGPPIVRDSHVPWEAHPYDYQWIEVVDDAAQDWALEGFRHADGVFSVTLSREAVTGDQYDRPFHLDGFNRLVWSFDGRAERRYHGPTQRGVAAIYFADAAYERLPSGPAIKTLDITMDRYRLPNKAHTYYSCQSFDLPNDRKRHIIAFEPLIDRNNVQHVHHIVVHRCKNNAFFNLHRTPVACGPDPAHMFDEYHDGGGGAGGKGDCDAQVYAWAAGAGNFVLPEEAGLPMGAGFAEHIILELHYDNQAFQADIVDSSGFRIYYTDELREHDAGIMNVGDPLVNAGRVADARGPGFAGSVHHTNQCPSKCTEKMQSAITVFGSNLHAHYKGKTLWSEIWRDGKFLSNTNKIEYWSNGFQSHTKTRFTVQPGDTLVTHCVFDVRKGETWYGSTTQDEMCMEFLFYYPVQYVDEDKTVVLDKCGPIRTDQAADPFAYACGNFGATGAAVSTLFPWGIPAAPPARGADEAAAAVLQRFDAGYRVQDPKPPAPGQAGGGGGGAAPGGAGAGEKQDSGAARGAAVSASVVALVLAAAAWAAAA